MVGVRLITTRRFAVYGSTKDKGLGTALEPSSSSTNINNKAAAGASAMSFEKDGAEIEVPTMRLRELNKSNASRCVHFGCCCSGLALHPSVRPLLPLTMDSRSMDSMVNMVNGQRDSTPA